METLVFLHGGLVRPENYQALLDSLGQKYQVVAPVLYELIDSQNFSWKKFAQNLDRRVGKKKVYLVGSSLGGGLALAYASFYPHKVRAMIVCEPVGAKIKRHPIIWVCLLSKMAARALFYPSGAKTVGKLLFALIGVCVTYFKEIWSVLMMAYQQDLEKSVIRIEAPVYLWWSQNSGVLSLKMGERLHQRIKTSFFDKNFSDKNHLWVMLEQEKVSQEIKKIFERDLN